MYKTVKFGRFRSKHRIAVALLLGYWCVIAIGTHLPMGPSTAVPYFSDKWLHFGAFTGLAFLLAASLMRTRPSVRMMMVLIAVALGYGAVDEITQGWIPNRVPDWADWVVDGLGACVGLLAYLTVLKMIRGVQRTPSPSWTSKTVPIKDAA
jgi:VanZ family protein